MGSAVIEQGKKDDIPMRSNGNPILVHLKKQIKNMSFGGGIIVKVAIYESLANPAREIRKENFMVTMHKGTEKMGKVSHTKRCQPSYLVIEYRMEY